MFAKKGTPVPATVIYIWNVFFILKMYIKISLCREPLSLQPIFTILVNELLRGEKTGFPVADFTKAIEDPRRFFCMKVFLTFSFVH